MTLHICGLILVFMTILLPECKGQRCPGDFRRTLEWCYLLTGEPVEFSAAKTICVMHNAIPMTVHSQAEQDILLKFRGSVDPPIQSVWLYLSDQDVELRFKWLDGSDLDYENWETEGYFKESFGGNLEKSEDDSLDCVVAVGDQMLWREVTCSNPSHVICKREQIGWEGNTLRGYPLDL